MPAIPVRARDALNERVEVWFHWSAVQHVGRGAPTWPDVEQLHVAGLGLASFFDLLRESGRQSRLERFLSTHPLSADRARRLRARVSAWTP